MGTPFSELLGEQDLISPGEIEQTENALEAVRDAFGLESKHQAAIVANQVRLARLEERENELLEAIREEGVVNIDRVDIASDALGAALENAIRRVYTGDLIQFPSAGARRSLPDTVNTNAIQADLQDGTLDIPVVGQVAPDSLQTLRRLDADNAISGSLFVDSPITLRTFDHRQEKTGEFTTSGAGFLNFSNTRVSLFEIESDFPFLVGGAFSTAIDKPIDAVVKNVSLTRFGYLAQTTATGVAIPFVTGSTNAPDDFGVNSLQAAATQFGNTVIPAGSMDYHTFIVQNLSANDANVQFRGVEIEGEQQVADVDIHGTPDLTTAFETVAGNDFGFFQSGVQLNLRSVVGVDATATQHAELEVQYLGKTPALR